MRKHRKPRGDTCSVGACHKAFDRYPNKSIHDRSISRYDHSRGMSQSERSCHKAIDRWPNKFKRDRSVSRYVHWRDKRWTHVTHDGYMSLVPINPLASKGMSNVTVVIMMRPCITLISGIVPHKDSGCTTRSIEGFPGISLPGLQDSISADSVGVYEGPTTTFVISLELRLKYSHPH
jgi:hypothetical protein